MEDILNKVVLHPKFYKVISDLNNSDIMLINQPTEVTPDFQATTFAHDGKLLTTIDKIKKIKLNAKEGYLFKEQNLNLAAHDESIIKYLALEGSAVLTSHSLIIQAEEYTPVNFLSLYFYTKSKKIAHKSNSVKYSQDIELDNRKDYIKDQINFLIDYTPRNSILFIDGPLIGGNYYVYLIQAMKLFLEKDIIPIFIVKNSSSDLVTDNIAEIKNDYHSDLHWTHKFLNFGESTNFFRYQDRRNPKNSKVFCYMKASKISPLRIECHSDVYQKHHKLLPQILNLIYYLVLVQGNANNPQMRLIAIAEKYARQFIKVIPFEKILNNTIINPTLDQTRFGG